MVLGALVLGGCSLMALPFGPSDCEECKETRLCKEHKEADSAAIKRLKPKLRSKEKSDRLGALKELGLLNAEHSNAPSKAVTALIASALKDEAYLVKAESARLLKKGEHPEVSVRALVEALSDVRADLAKMGRGRGRGGQGDSGARGQGEEAFRYAGQVVESLGMLPDDRSVKALADFLSQLSRWTSRRFAVPAARSLIQLGARKGLDVLVKRVHIASVSAASSLGQQNQRGWNDNSGKEIHELLVSLARSRDLAATPRWGDDSAGTWREWFARNQKHFPAKLGKISLEKIREAHGE